MLLHTYFASPTARRSVRDDRGASPRASKAQAWRRSLGAQYGGPRGMNPLVSCARYLASCPAMNDTVLWPGLGGGSAVFGRASIPLVERSSENSAAREWYRRMYGNVPATSTVAAIFHCAEDPPGLRVRGGTDLPAQLCLLPAALAACGSGVATRGDQMAKALGVRAPRPCRRCSVVGLCVATLCSNRPDGDRRLLEDLPERNWRTAAMAS